jgi:hypothetical protein
VTSTKIQSGARTKKTRISSGEWSVLFFTFSLLLLQLSLSLSFIALVFYTNVYLFILKYLFIGHGIFFFSFLNHICSKHVQAAQGYEGLSVFLVLSAFLFTYSNVALCYDEPDDGNHTHSLIRIFLPPPCSIVIYLSRTYV